MNECGSSKQQLMTLYKQLNYDVVSNIKLWKDQNVLLCQKIIDCCETTNGNLSDIADILDEYIVILSDCCRTINGNLTLILEGAEQICIECVHLPVTTTTTEECEPGTTEEPDITTEEPTYTTGEPGPEECDQPTEFHDKGTFYPYMVEKFLGPDTGMVTLQYETYDIPDRFIVMFGGVAVIDTGYHGNPIFEPRLNAALAIKGVAPVSVNASQVGQASFIKTTAEDHAYVLVYAPLRNTAFNFILSCPGPFTTTTSEEEDVTTTSEEIVFTTTEEQVLTTTEEQVATTTGEPCLLDIEVLYPPQPEVTTTSSEEPEITTTSSEVIVTTTSEEPATTTSTTEAPITTTTTEYVPDAFIFEIQAAAETVSLPLLAVDDDGNAATHNFNVYWDWENHPETSELVVSASASHTYTTPGLYVVVVEGVCQTFATRSKTGSTTHPIAQKITRVLRWGTVADFKLLNFYGCINLTELPHDVTEEPYVGSDGTITGAANINTFENFLYSCTKYVKVISGKLFSQTPSVTTFKYTFGASGVYGDIPSNLFSLVPLVTSFEGTFANSNVGLSASYALPSTLFAGNPLVTTFNSTFYTVKYQPAIPSGLFTNNPLVTDFTSTFARSYYSTSPKYWYGSVDAYLFQPCGTNVIRFTGTFSASNITGINPDYLFGSNSNAEYFDNTFRYCRDLTTGIFKGTTHDSLFWNNTKVKTFNGCFAEDVNISDKLEDCPNLFKYAGASVLSFGWTFMNCASIYGDLPVSLFAENTSVTTFDYTFYCGGDYYGYLGYGATGVLPSDLFRYNTKVTNFENTFRRQIYLTLASNGLFRYNTACVKFIQTFNLCVRINVEKYLFSEVFESSTTRFNGKGVNFHQMFMTSQHNGIPLGSTAPEIWDTGKYTGLNAGWTSQVFTNCKRDSQTERYLNFNDIPCTWRMCTGCNTGTNCIDCTTTTTSEP